MENNFLEKYAIEQLRLQRHDFMNYLQVIYGYMQINKPAEAINYIKNINKHMLILSRIFNLECDALGMFFQEFINKLNKINIEIEIDLEIEYISSEHFSKDIEKKKELFNTVTDELLYEFNYTEYGDQKLYIYIFGLPEDFYIAISSAKKIKDEYYHNHLFSVFKSERNKGRNEPYVFFKGDSCTALLLNYN